jgi:CRP/FNR family transcriptional regulator
MMNLALISPPVPLSPLAVAQEPARNAITPVAQGAPLAELLKLLSAPAAKIDPGDANEPLRLWRVRCGATLFHEGADTPWLYFIHTGSFKTLRTGEDGYQQVLSMLLPGDMLGFETLCCEQLPASAVALEDSTVYALTVGELATLEQRYPAFDLAVQRALTRQLVRYTEMAEVMAAVAADARLARFVLWLSARMAAQGESSRRLRLRLGRRDVASLLGLAHETVSRAFTTLACSGCLRVNNRELEITDREQLLARARHTRGLLDDDLRTAQGRPAPDRAAA